MDIQKDSPIEEGIATFVDRQSVRTNPFGENRVGERAYRRTERLCSAIFLLTNHIPQIEPLKQECRNLSLRLLSTMLAVRDEMRASNSESAHDLRSYVRQLISCVRLLAISGYISFQNAETVSEALDALASFLNASQRSSLSESNPISRDDLLDVRDTIRSRKSDRRMSEKDPESDNMIKDTGRSISLSGQSNALDEGGLQNNNRESSRARAIIEILRVNGELGIRDVASNLPEYSEKMIQRELAELTTKGIVKKTGLKRWSRYALIS